MATTLAVAAPGHVVAPSDPLLNTPAAVQPPPPQPQPQPVNTQASNAQAKLLEGRYMRIPTFILDYMGGSDEELQVHEAEKHDKHEFIKPCSKGFATLLRNYVLMDRPMSQTIEIDGLPGNQLTGIHVAWFMLSAALLMTEAYNSGDTKLHDPKHNSNVTASELHAYDELVTRAAVQHKFTFTDIVGLQQVGYSVAWLTVCGQYLHRKNHADKGTVNHLANIDIMAKVDEGSKLKAMAAKQGKSILDRDRKRQEGKFIDEEMGVMHSSMYSKPALVPNPYINKREDDADLSLANTRFKGNIQTDGHGSCPPYLLPLFVIVDEHYLSDGVNTKWSPEPKATKNETSLPELFKLISQHTGGGQNSLLVTTASKASLPDLRDAKFLANFSDKKINRQRSIFIVAGDTNEHDIETVLGSALTSSRGAQNVYYNDVKFYVFKNGNTEVPENALHEMTPVFDAKGLTWADSTKRIFGTPPQPATNIRFGNGAHRRVVFFFGPHILSPLTKKTMHLNPQLGIFEPVCVKGKAMNINTKSFDYDMVQLAGARKAIETMFSMPGNGIDQTQGQVLRKLDGQHLIDIVKASVSVNGGASFVKLLTMTVNDFSVIDTVGLVFALVANQALSEHAIQAKDVTVDTLKLSLMYQAPAAVLGFFIHGILTVSTSKTVRLYVEQAYSFMQTNRDRFIKSNGVYANMQLLFPNLGTMPFTDIDVQSQSLNMGSTRVDLIQFGAPTRPSQPEFYLVRLLEDTKHEHAGQPYMYIRNKAEVTQQFPYQNSMSFLFAGLFRLAYYDAQKWTPHNGNTMEDLETDFQKQLMVFYRSFYDTWKSELDATRRNVAVETDVQNNIDNARQQFDQLAIRINFWWPLKDETALMKLS